MSCDKCKSGRIIHVSGKTSDMCSINGQPDGKYIDRSDYVPSGIGLGDDEDYLDFAYCLDCGKIQGKFPISKSKVAKLLTDETDG